MLTEQKLEKLWVEKRKGQEIAYEEAKVSFEWIIPSASFPAGSIRFGVLTNLTPRAAPRRPQEEGNQS